MCANNCQIGGYSSDRNNCPAVNMRDSVWPSLPNDKILLRSDLKLYIST